MSLRIRWRDGVAQLNGTIRGQRIRKSLGTRDPKVADAFRAQEEARLWRAATYGAENEATFADACILYLKHQAPKNHYLTRIIPKLGKTKLGRITSGHVRILAMELYPNAKPQTRNRQVLAPISAVMHFAHDLGLGPLTRIKRFAPVDEKVKRAVDRAWIDQFRAHAGPHMAACALFLHTTAARTGEALLLRPQELDLANATGWSRKATKNGVRRKFWLTGEMTEELKHLPPRAILYGPHKGELRIFGWHDKSGFARAWRATCVAAGLDYVTPHEAGRHSFATEAITRQERNPVMVAKIGNWKNTTVLMKNYAHPENLEAFVEEVYGARNGTKSARRESKNLKLLRRSI